MQGFIGYFESSVPYITHFLADLIEIPNKGS
jgi:hypothetical protein